MGIAGVGLFVVLAGSVLGVLTSLPYLLAVWNSSIRTAPISGLRRAAANLGLVALTAQALHCMAIWTPLLGSPRFLLANLAIEGALLLTAIPCAFAWSSKLRWRLGIGSVSCGFIAFYMTIILLVQ